MSVEETVKPWSDAKDWCKKYGDGWSIYSLDYVSDINAYNSVKRALEYGGYKTVTVAPYALHDDYYGMAYYDEYLYWSNSNDPYNGNNYYSYYFYLENGKYTSKWWASSGTNSYNVRAFIKL